jgi:hypothetical protein
MLIHAFPRWRNAPFWLMVKRYWTCGIDQFKEGSEEDGEDL